MRIRSTVSYLAILSLGALTAVAAPLVLEGGTVHPISGAPFSGRVVIENGIIAAVGADVAAPAGATTIDVTGQHVYPGLLDALSRLGMLEIGSVPATDDRAEMGTYNPHLEALTAMHPASEVIPVTRSNGITHAVVAPAADDDGVIAGRAALVHLDGWTVEEMAIESSIGMAIAWPEIETRRFDFATFSIKETPFNEAKEKAEEQQDELQDWIDAARHYKQAEEAGSSRLQPDLRLAALAATLDQGLPVLIRATAERDIEAAIEFADTNALRMVLVGGRDAWKVREQLAEKEIPVLLGLTQSLPREQDDPYDRPFENPGMLVDSGIKIGFASAAGGGFGPGGPHNSRTVPYEAAQAVPFGLSEADALKALTIWPAEILGVDDRLGTIEPGKIANLIVTDGSPLEITTRVTQLIIAGRQVSTTNRQLELYERYRAR